MKQLKLIKDNINQHKIVLETITDKEIKKILKFYNILLRSIEKKGTIFWCGNGGSASDSQHLAAELIGRYRSNRKPLKSISLNADTSVLTCIANDFGYEKIFSRQLEGIASSKDVLIVISTSGNSKNILNAIKTANKKRMQVIGFLGKNGGACKNLIKNKLIINSNNTARIQEMHIMIGHVICDLIEEKFGL